MCEWKRIELKDKPFFDNIFKKHNLQGSEMTFAYLYMWRKDYNFSYTVKNNMICLVSNSKNYVPFSFCPIPVESFNQEEYTKTIQFLKYYFDNKGWKLFFGRVADDMLQHFKKNENIRINFK